MGYSIYIGEAMPCNCGDPECGITVRVNRTEIPEAPALDYQGGHTNLRMPSYGEWSKFAKATGLESLFGFNQGLMKGHPGIARIKPQHLKTIQQAICKHVLIDPSFSQEYRDRDPESYREDRNRLTWLEFWMKWALRHCKKPTLFNC